MNITKLQVKKFLIFILFGLVTTILVTVCSYSIKEQVTEMQTLQYNATYDFETKIETDKDGEEKFVMYVETPEQLAGAMGVASNNSVKKNYVRYLKKKKIKLFNKVSFRDIDSIISTINDVVKLTKNINLNFNSWTAKDFGADLDGQGHVIHKLCGYGFVSKLKSGGTIENLVISNSSLTKTGSYAGIVARINNGTIRNVSIVGDSSLNGSSASYVGGLVGENTGEIYNCINYATVHDGSSSIGGIVGSNSGTISHCFNKNDVYDKDTSNINVGGISGFNKGIIEFCENKGDVYCATEATYGTGLAGGIVGYSKGTVTHCGNQGEIYCGKDVYDRETGSIKEAYVGGIVGKMEEGLIDYCYNKNDIYGCADVKKENLTTKNADKIKKISARYMHQRNLLLDHWTYYMESYSSADWYEIGRNCFLGGIAGWGDNATISNCYNTGYIRNYINGPVEQKITIYTRQRNAHTRDVEVVWWTWEKGWLGIKYPVRHSYWTTKNLGESIPVTVTNIIRYDSHYNYSPICPTPTLKAKKCYSTNKGTPYYKDMGIDSKRTVYIHGSGHEEQVKIWKKYHEWINLDLISDINYHIDASNPSKIWLYASFDRNGEIYFFHVDTGLTSSATYKIPNSNDKHYNSVPIYGDWVVDKNFKLNEGDPYPKGMYWIDKE